MAAAAASLAVTQGVGVPVGSDRGSDGRSPRRPDWESAFERPPTNPAYRDRLGRRLGTRRRHFSMTVGLAERRFTRRTMISEVADGLKIETTTHRWFE
jgi:hypothetical protein